jgi:hypothetical protein
MEAKCSSETSVDSLQTTQQYIQEGRAIHLTHVQDMHIANAAQQRMPAEERNSCLPCRNLAMDVSSLINYSGFQWTCHNILNCGLLVSLLTFCIIFLCLSRERYLGMLYDSFLPDAYIFIMITSQSFCSLQIMG